MPKFGGDQRSGNKVRTDDTLPLSRSKTIGKTSGEKRALKWREYYKNPDIKSIEDLKAIWQYRVHRGVLAKATGKKWLTTYFFFKALEMRVIIGAREKLERTSDG